MLRNQRVILIGVEDDFFGIGDRSHCLENLIHREAIAVPRLPREARSATEEAGAVPSGSTVARGRSRNMERATGESRREEDNRIRHPSSTTVKPREQKIRLLLESWEETTGAACSENSFHRRKSRIRWVA